ncbi:MAG TPA: aldehyde dehydrogenase family protein [Pseudonocardiaceae bacterium]|nr:aldehyde dehydrogenase family protein [Pseudonocardiaceae bacterium]
MPRTEPAVSGTFDSLDPATGEVVATFPRHGEQDVRDIVAAAREAAGWWGELDFDERKRALLRWCGEIAARQEDLVSLMHAENGKPRDDAFLEVLLSLEHIVWAARNARRVLRPRRVPSGMLMINHAAYLEYRPYGVIGVIGPWNYPVFTPMGSITYALAAGNAVVFKPSEYTPAVGRWFVDAFRQANPDAPAGVLSLVTGLGDTGAALCRSGVDKLAFTGSAATGRKVAAACAENLTPVLMECGGKDALIVAEDADVAAAADAAVWGALSNAGQTCVGVERVYVTRPVREAFLAEVQARAAKARPGSDAEATYGPMTMPGQADIVRRHVSDALAAGGTALVGGTDSIKERFVSPVVIVDAPESSAAVREETFGPTITVRTVADVDEAVRLANDTPYGLGSTVFSRRRGMEIARRIKAGMTSINAVIAFAGVPSLPFGGSGESGYGRIHGDHGLREFAQPKAITKRRFKSLIELTTFERNPKQVDLLRRVSALRYARYRNR